MGGFNGGFLNMGTPELIVIGAVAWAVLGPKELFKLAKQAGEFLGEWQQLGQQAKDTFTSALEQEMMEDDAKKAAETAVAAPPAPEWGETPPAEPAFASSSSSSIPPLADYAAARGATNGQSAVFTADEEAALRDSMYETLGDPASNAAAFEEQISGARNSAVLSEFPAELRADDLLAEVPGDGSAMDVQTAEELMIQTQIAEAENSLETLRTEKRILALKRAQVEQNEQRARRMAEEREEAAAAEASVVEKVGEATSAEQPHSP